MADKSVNFLDELRAEKTKPCKFAKMLDSMDPDLREQVRQALADGSFSTAQILRGIEKRCGRLVGGRHKLQECRYHCDCGELNG